MKIAFISSTEFPELTKLSTIQMALAHMVQQDEGYADHYRALSDAGDFVILDNSAFEFESQGRGVEPEVLLAAAERIKASEIIVPDVVYDGEATVKAAEDFLKKVDFEKLGDVSLMCVPQGKTRDEWLTCAEALAFFPFSTIGLSKLSVPKCFGQDGFPMIVSRGRALSDLLELTTWGVSNLLTSSPEPFIHLLGGDWSLPFELALYNEHFAVRSNDSSFAYWYTARGAKLDLEMGLMMKDGQLAYFPDKPDLTAPLDATLKLRALGLAGYLRQVATVEEEAVSVG